MEWRHTVWPEAEIVYTALAKVANTSVKSALLATFKPDASRANPHAADISYEAIAPYQIPKEYPDFLHFAVVRDPHDRFVSFWADKIVGDGMNDGIAALGFYEGMSFEDTVKVAVAIPDEETDPHLRSQSYLLTNSKGKLNVDVLLRFDRLSDDWGLLAHVVRHRTGRELGTIPRRRTSDHKPFQTYYEQATWDAISARYAVDRQLLMYDGPRVPRTVASVDDRLERMLANSPGASVLDMTPATGRRQSIVIRGGGHYLASARSNQRGQLVRMTSLERGRMPESAFDVLVVQSADAESKQPHRWLVEQFESTGRTVLAVD